MKWITTAILVGLLAGCQCVAPPSPDIYRECAESAAATRHYLYYDHFQTALEYDAYLTWKNYNGQGWPNDALYMWNGEEVGTGGDGFVIVLRKMRQLPPYSRNHKV